jgi:hypothetical protein
MTARAQLGSGARIKSTGPIAATVSDTGQVRSGLRAGFKVCRLTGEDGGSFASLRVLVPPGIAVCTTWSGV